MQPLSARFSGARSSIESVVPNSPNLAKSSRQGAQAKPQSQKPRDAVSGKENKPPRTTAHALESPQASVDYAATPLPQTRTFKGVTPEALAKPCSRMPVFHLPGIASRSLERAMEQSPLEPVKEAEFVLHAAPEQVLPQMDPVGGHMPVKNTFINFDVPDSSPYAGLRAETKPLSGDSAPKSWAPGQFRMQDRNRHDIELPQLDSFDGQMPVKNTFISFDVPDSSPCGAPRAKTKPLSGDSEPKDWAPAPFGILDSDRDELSKFVAAFWISHCDLDTALMQASQDLALQDAPGTPVVKDTTTPPAFMGDSPEPCFMGVSPEDLPSWGEQTAVENVVVVNLQQALDQAVPAPKQDAKRIQLNLSLWIASDPPASSSKASTACAPPPLVRLAAHHFPVSHALPSTSPRASTSPSDAAARVGTGPDMPSDALLSRRLFHN